MDKHHPHQKQKTSFQKLQDIYKQWQDFMTKSKIKMKKKLKKDKKEYYDFDYTRGQYYYSYPQNHINFATPEIQKHFIKDMLEKETQDFSQIFVNKYQDGFILEDQIKPYELQEFLRDFNKKMHQQIAQLRIQKSLFIHDNLTEKDTIQLMQSQIRSYFHRYNRLHQIFFTFSKSLAQRLIGRTSTLKAKKFDQFHFSQIQKGDFVVYLRLQAVEQRINFNLQHLQNVIQLQIPVRRSEIMKRCYDRRGKEVKKLQIKHVNDYDTRKTYIQKHLTEHDPNFFENEQNLRQLQDFLQNLDYMKQMNKNTKCYYNINCTYKQVQYVPYNQKDMKKMLFYICGYYFPEEMIANLYNHKKQHLCYRLNYFASIMLRTLSQTYNFIVQIKQKDLHMHRNTMKRQLQTIFTNQIDKLFNIAQHEIIVLVDEGPYFVEQFKFKACSQKQQIFKQYFNNNNIIDPYTQAIMNLIDIYNDKITKEVIDSYSSQLVANMNNRLKYLSVYYRNYHSDQKSHLINLLNEKLLFGIFNQNVLFDKLAKILNTQNKIDFNLLKTIYMLYVIHSIQLKKELDNLINAQISIMYRLKYRMQLLKYKHHVPFQMSQEFINRFTETNNQPQPFQFAAKNQNSRDGTYPDPQNHDKIIRIKRKNDSQKVQVRRMIPENPLFEGKRILYRQTMKESDQTLKKLHNICAFMIERRQNYLHEQKFTGIVDRFQLIESLLSHEVCYQNKKLAYMQELISVYEKTTHPQGLSLITQQIIDTKGAQFYYNLNQAHFEEDYSTESATWQLKADILRKIASKQSKYQEQQKYKFKADLFKHNHINNLPEISSVYYCDELPMEMQDDNIMQQPDEQSISEMSESQFVMNSSKFKSDNRSEFSAMSSEYHVKTTFKQILGRNSNNQQISQQNKREELMGKKKKKLVNDSVLGGILTYQKCNYLQYIHKTVQFMKHLHELYLKTMKSNDPGICKEYYQQILSTIESVDEYSIRGKQLLQEATIHRILGQSNRAINRVTQKIKFNPSQLDEYLFMNSQILKNLAGNTSGDQVNDIRGLYTCLNCVKLQKMHYKLNLLGKYQQKQIQKRLHEVIRHYSCESIPKQGLFLSDNYLTQQSYFINSFRLISNLTKKNQPHLYYIGNYSSYLSFSMLVNYSFMNYYKSALLYFYELISDYQSLRNQLQLIELYGCYFAGDNQIKTVQNIQNRVFVRRKYQFLVGYQNKLLNPTLVRQFIQIPKQKLQNVREIAPKQITDDASLLGNSIKFEQYILELGELCFEMDLISKRILFNIRQKEQLIKLKQICKVLPFIQNYVHIRAIDNFIFKDTFNQHFQAMNGSDKIGQSQQNKIVLQYNRLAFFTLNKNSSKQMLAMVKQQIGHIIKRKYAEFTQRDGDNSMQKYYHHLQLVKYQQPYRFCNVPIFKQFYDFWDNYTKNLKLRMWIQAKLIFFGVSLTPPELLQLRLVFMNSQDNFWIFWRDQSSKLIKHADVVRMRSENVDELSVIDHYTLRFISFQNLKVRYKQFLDNLAELDIKNEGLQVVNLYYIGCKRLFADEELRVPNFLSNYCFIENIKNQISLFTQFAVRTNPNRYIANYQQPLSFSKIKTNIWNHNNLHFLRKDLVFLDQRCSIIKQTLNCSNTKMNQLTNELAIQLYREERMKEFHKFLNIQVNNTSKFQFRQYLKRFQQNLLLGVDKLNKIQKYLSKFVQKIVKQKPELLSIKDQILQKIYQSRFYEQLIVNKLYDSGTQSLRKQIQLGNILYQNYVQKQIIRENKIIKATLNKVLVPKIIINPYLQSPLILQNYFFAGSLKLSYIDSFLNKLKNRAIMIELAEGGFGFLLKITELDECVQSLCKGIITFTQKQFSDRFRSFLQTFDELKQKYRKSCTQNGFLKELVTICRQQWGKQLKSLLYTKLNTYISTIHTKEKTYESMFNIIKSLQIQVAKEISTKYQSKIEQLQQQNNSLKQNFVTFKQIMSKNTRMSMEQSKDNLYKTFKKQVEGILNKETIKDYEQVGEKHYEQQQDYAVNVLLNKLRSQKIFYQMKIATVETKYKYKLDEINKLKEEFQTLQNTLTLQQYKNVKIAEQIKLLHDKNIQIQELKKEIHKKEEQEVLNKFKLIKINQNLQGKLSRIEQKNKNEIKSYESTNKKQQKTMAVQTSQNQKKQPRNFRIRTEQSIPIQSSNKVQQIPLWKQKWQHSQRKYQILMSKVVQIYQTYKMNKNSLKLAEKLGQVSEECMNNRIIPKRN